VRASWVLSAVVIACLALAPAAWAGGVPVNATEGANFSGPVATFNQPVDAATISWGDGGTSTFTSNGSTTVSGSHTYAEEGSYPITVTVTQCAQPPCPPPATTTATIADAALSASGPSFSATSGASFNGQVATFSDADPGGSASDYGATINWGDGSSSAGTIGTSASGARAVDGSHTYAAPGSYTVSVSITDQGGASVSASGTATVSGPPTFSVSRNKAVAGDYIRFDASTAPASHDATAYRWDFAGTGAPQAACGADQPVVYHAFPAGTHTVSLYVTESSGATTRYEQTITVTGPAGSPVRGRVRTDGFHLPDALTTAPIGGGSAAVKYTRDPAIGFCPQIEPPPAAGCSSAQNAVQFGLFDAVADPAWCEEHRPGPKGATTTVWKAKPGQVVRVNGVDLVPQPGVAIILKPAADQVTTEGGSGQVDVVLHAPPEFGGDIDLGTSRLNWHPRPGDTTYGLPDFPLPGDSLLGFALDGTASAQLVQNAAAVTVHLQLPSEFQPPGGGTITSDVTIGADNEDGVRLDGLDVEAKDLFLGALEVKDFGVIYQRDEDLWEGHGSVVLPSATTISAEPPAPYGFAIKDGHFDHAGAKVDFPGAGIPLAGGITLKTIGAAVGTHPTYFRGDIGLRWFDLVHLDGTVQLYFATPGEPLHVSTSIGDVDYTSTTLLTTGALSVSTPFGDVAIADAYLNWFYPDYVQFGGGIDFKFFPGFNIIEVKAGFNANAELSAAKFDIEGSASVCVVDGTLCGGGDFVFSSHGVGGCLRTFLGDYGADYEYGGSLHLMAYSCDASAAREVVPFPAADLAAGDRLVRIKPGLRGAIIGVKGQGGAPYLILSGPRGQSVATPYPDGTVNNHQYLVARSRSANETFFVIGHPAPGLWKLTPMSGSVPIKSVVQGYTLPAPSVHVSVSGRGRAFALRYAIRPLAGQSVQFVEQGKHEYHALGRARGSRGILRFTPGLGPAGRRKIEAKVYSYGALRKILVLTSYRAPGLPIPPTPHRVRARRAGGSLLITWSRTPGASRFGVAAVLTDGRHLGFVLRASARSVRIPRFRASDSALVRVMALAPSNLPGRQVKVRVARQRTHPRRHAHRRRAAK
jgi:hypothetical protein